MIRRNTATTPRSITSPRTKAFPRFSSSTAAQAERLEAVLKGAGIPTERFAARQTDHSKLNESLGLPDDPPTKVLFEFVADALQ